MERSNVVLVVFNTAKACRAVYILILSEDKLEDTELEFAA